MFGHGSGILAAAARVSTRTCDDGGRLFLRGEWLEEHVGHVSSAFRRGDRQPEVFLRFVERERQEAAALRFLSYQFMDPRPNGRSVAKFQKRGFTSMTEQAIAVQLSDPGQTLVVVVSAQRAGERGVVETCHSGSSLLFHHARATIKPQVA